MTKRKAPHGADWESTMDASLKALPSLVTKAKAGDPFAKKRLLDVFCAMVDAGKTPYRALLVYLSNAIGQALAHENIPNELGKSLAGGPQHRPRDPETEFLHWQVAWNVAELRAAGMKLADAVSETAGEFEELGLDDDAVLKAYKRHSKHADFRNAVRILVESDAAGPERGSSVPRTG